MSNPTTTLPNRIKGTAPRVGARAVLVSVDTASTATPEVGQVTTVQALWPSGSVAPASLLAMAKLALLTGKPTVRRMQMAQGSAPLNVLAMPMPGVDDGRVAQAVAVVLPAMDATSAASMPSPSQPDEASGDKDPLAERNRAISALRLLAALNGQESFEGAAIAFVGELAQLTGATRVGLGLVNGESIQVAALSGASNVNPKSPLIRDLGMAMDEAIDQASTIVYPGNETRGARVMLAHGRFVARHDSPVLCTVPLLMSNDKVRALVGAITLEFDNDRRLDSRAIRFVETVGSFLGQPIDARRRLGTVLTGKLSRALSGRPRELLRTRSRGWRLGLTGIVVVLVSLALVPVPYRINADARIEGAMQRVLTAPVAGYIGTVHARPGDRVVKGQPVIDLDDRELRLEERKWTSEIAQTQKRYGEAMAAEDQTEIAVQRTKLAQGQAQLNVINDQLERIRLRAPFDGLVIGGDLSQSLGAPVKRGETLVTVSPQGDFRIMVQVDERELGAISTGQRGTVVLPALPGRSIAIELERIIPVALARDGRNLFEVQARLLDDPAGLRPGLSGIAKVDIGRRPVLDSLTLELRRWVSEALWKWRL